MLTQTGTKAALRLAEARADLAEAQAAGGRVEPILHAFSELRYRSVSEASQFDAAVTDLEDFTTRVVPALLSDSIREATARLLDEVHSRQPQRYEGKEADRVAARTDLMKPEVFEALREAHRQEIARRSARVQEGK